MIARIYFTKPVPINLQMRSESFETVHGWSIEEEEPGRVRLQKRDERGALLFDVTAEGHAYTLHHEQDELPPDSMTPAEVLAMLAEPDPQRLAGLVLDASPKTRAEVQAEVAKIVRPYWPAADEKLEPPQPPPSKADTKPRGGRRRS